MDFKERTWDLSVPSVRDIEAPLGGTSTVYEIVLVEGDEQFTYTKTFREIEDFAKKLQKKFTSESFPTLYSGADVELKRQASQALLKFIAKKPAIISSSITQQFMGQERSVKHIVKDRNQNPAAPPLATVKQDLFDDLFKESEFLSNKKRSNLFEDDNCELFSSTLEKNSEQKVDTTATKKTVESQQEVSKELNDTESESDETDQIFVPRKSSLIQPEDLYEDTEDLFRVDDNLNDLLMTVSARAEAAKAKKSTSGSEKPVRDSPPPPETQAAQPATPAAKVCDTGGKPVVPNKPSLPAKPAVNRPPKPVLKPKPAHLQNKSSSRPEAKTSGSAQELASTTSSAQAQAETMASAQAQVKTMASSQAQTTSSDLNPVDISSYIVAAEKDSQREVSLFDD